MAHSLLWKSLPAEQLAAVAEETDPSEVKGLLRKYIGVDPEDSKSQNEVLFDFHFFNLAFAREQSFTPEKTSTFMSIMIDTVGTDRADGLRTMAGSFDSFKLLLHKHAVERPPVSSGIFSVDDVRNIVDYVTNSYYRHFRLYKYVLAKKPKLVLTQRSIGRVDAPPRTLRPLASALQEG